MTKLGQTYPSNTCSFLLYVYNENEELVFEKKEVNIDTTNYRFNLQLAKGTYNIVAVGFDAYVDSLWFDGKYVIAERSAYQGLNTYYNDYFYKKSSLIINGDTNKDIQLSRITGRIELNIKDINKISTMYNFDYVECIMDSIAYGLYPKTGSCYRSHNNLYLTKSEWLNFNSKPIIFNAMPYSSSCIQIKLLLNNNVVKDFTGIIPRFEVYSNKKTIITGSLMPDITENGFNPSFDTNWGETNNISF